MPGFDGTGPAGRGPGTGGGFGPCGAARIDVGNFRGSGYARGGGRRSTGRARRWSYGMPGPEDEKVLLKEQIERLKSELAETEQRITDLEEG